MIFEKLKIKKHKATMVPNAVPDMINCMFESRGNVARNGWIPPLQVIHKNPASSHAPTQPTPFITHGEDSLVT
jgi:hypothetical protein